MTCSGSKHRTKDFSTKFSVLGDQSFGENVTSNFFVGKKQNFSKATDLPWMFCAERLTK